MGQQAEYQEDGKRGLYRGGQVGEEVRIADYNMGPEGEP